MRVLLLISMLSLAPHFAQAKSDFSHLDLYLEIEKTPSKGSWDGIFTGFGRLYVMPDGRFCATRNYDISPFETGGCGRLRDDGRRLVAVGKLPASPRVMHEPPYVKVAWGPRRYLVVEKELLDFINDINSAAEPRYGHIGGGANAFLKSEDHNKLVAGWPDLPEPYRDLLLEKPLVAAPAGISTRTQTFTLYGRTEIEDCSASARFAIGSDSGVFVGMKLSPLESDIWAAAVIVSTRPDSSDAIIRQDDCDESDPIPSGTRFSTRPGWRFNVVYSTEPLTSAIRFYSPHRFPALPEAAPERLFIEHPFVGAKDAGFSWDEVAQVTFRAGFSEAFELDAIKSRISAQFASLGGNAYTEDGVNTRDDEARGGIAERSFRLYRVTWGGRPVDSDVWRRLHLLKAKKGEDSRFDWARAAHPAKND